MNLRERILDKTHGQMFSEIGIEAIVRAELLRAADAVANMHGESATKIAAHLRQQAE